MSIQERIRNWLGIADVIHSITELRNHQINMQRTFADIKAQLNIISPGLGRVIAKLDVKYAESEHSAERKAESDALGKEVLKRLHAEAKARAPYNE